MSTYKTKWYDVTIPLRKEPFRVKQAGPMQAGAVISRSFDLEEGETVLVEDARGKSRSYVVGRNPAMLRPRGRVG